jgi:hypothetical protein
MIYETSRWLRVWDDAFNSMGLLEIRSSAWRSSYFSGMEISTDL